VEAITILKNEVIIIALCIDLVSPPYNKKIVEAIDEDGLMNNNNNVLQFYKLLVKNFITVYKFDKVNSDA
jgi:hypothetical protein